MAKSLSVILCFSLSVQIVFCQFGFFPQRENRNNGFFQQVAMGPRRFSDRLSGFFNNMQPNRQPVINPGTPQENIYIIEVEEPRPTYQNYDPNYNNQNNFGRPVAFPTDNPVYNGNDQYNGNVNFQPNTNNVGVQQNDGNYVNQPTQGEYQNANNQDNSVRNEENDAVNFNDVPNVPQTTLPPLTPVTTLPPLTPVPTETPTPKTVSRNNFNFQMPNQGPFAETCTTADGGVGSCIAVLQCQPYLTIIQESRTNPAAVQLLRRVHCGFEGNTPKVCCPRPGIPTIPTVVTTTTTQAPTSPPTPPPTTAAPQDFTPKTASEDFVDALPDPPICGQSNATFSRVVGGVNAKLGDFPWMALLGYLSARTGSTNWLCGGSLITSRHVLTAAHCIQDHEKDLYVVRLGELDLSREDDGATPFDILIKYKIKHERYNRTSYMNDIGMLILQQDAPFTELIRPICIPKESELRARTFEDYTPMIAGWGHTQFRGPAATHLQVLQLPVVSNEFCSQAYRAFKAHKIDGRVLCAGYKQGGKDACQGDSGGPLMQPIWNQETYKTFFYQIGVVSYGKQCAEAGYPGVYTRVTEFVPWIEEKVIGRVST